MATRGAEPDDVWAGPTVPSLPKDSRAKAKNSAANEADEGDGPGLFGDGAGSVAAEWQNP